MKRLINFLTLICQLCSHTGEHKVVLAREETGFEAQGRTILNVEDETAILQLGKKILEKIGYRVLAANTPGEAIQTA